MGLAEAEGGGEQEVIALTTIGESLDDIPISQAREKFRQKKLSAAAVLRILDHRRKPQHPWQRGARKICTTCDIFLHGPTIFPRSKEYVHMFSPDR